MINRLFQSLAKKLVAVLMFTGVPLAQSAEPPVPPPMLPCLKCGPMPGGHDEHCPVPPGFDPRGTPDYTDLTHVDLRLDLRFDTSTLAGICDLTFTVQYEPITDFVFRLHSNFTITIATETNLATQATQPVTVEALDYFTRRAILTRAYSPGESIKLSITYNGPPAWGGFGSFGFGQREGQPIAWSLSEPYYAHTWWPCKDGAVSAPGDNSDKFTVDARFTVPENMTVPSNGLLVSSTPDGEGRITHHWQSNYPIATYLVSLCATNYNTWTVPYHHPGGTMPAQFFIYPEHDNPDTRAAWSRTVDMLAAFRAPFGEYPFINEKYGIYEFPFGGGMEHQTMTGQGTFAEWVTAHELGHQWWGDMITCRTWHDIWLNEGFATFAEAIWAERQPGGSMAAYHGWMAGRRPWNLDATVYAYNVADAGAIFDYNTSYLKASWIIHMLRGMLGDALFFEALAQYRAQYEFQSATTDDFQVSFSNTSGLDLANYFAQWVYSPGAPFYEWSAEPIMADGRHYLSIFVRQTQRQSFAHWPEPFAMPIEIRYRVDGNTYSNRVNNDEQQGWYCLAVDGPATDVQFDPDNWILHPPPTGVTPPPAPPVVVRTSPLPGESRPGSLHSQQLEVGFSLPVNVTAADVTLRGTSVGVVPLTIMYDSGRHVAVLTAPAPLANDTYTMEIRDSVTSQSSGVALDAELANPASPSSLPSGDGRPGGMAIIEFNIQRDPADLNDDLSVNAVDADLFARALLELPLAPEVAERADLNGDSIVDGDDLTDFVGAIAG